MSLDSEMFLSIAFEVGVISVSVIASFLIPGLVGLLVSGAIQFLGDLGIEFANGGFPNDSVWFITEFLMVFQPFFKEFKAVKLESKILMNLEKATQQAQKILDKIDNALVEGIESLKRMPNKQFLARSGLTSDLEDEVKVIEQQEVAREKFGTDKVKVKSPIVSLTPNTKNPDSWIASVAFVERTRFGPRDIRGDLMITYYTNNDARVGFALKPIEDIVLGRTSAGESVNGGKNNKDRYKKYLRTKSPEGFKTRTVIFKNTSYFSDYLGFCKAGSWGGYYMRRWMVGLPGRKGRASLNPLLLFGSIWRVRSKLKALSTDAKLLITHPSKIANKQVKRLIGRTKFGSSANKVVGIFKSTQSSISNPASRLTSITKSVGRKRLNRTRKNNINR